MTCLGIRDELSMLYIECCRSESSVVTLRLDVGSRLPLSTTAIGRACLAAAPAELRLTLEQRLRAADGVSEFEHTTLRDRRRPAAPRQLGGPGP